MSSTSIIKFIYNIQHQGWRNTQTAEEAYPESAHELLSPVVSMCAGAFHYARQEISSIAGILRMICLSGALTYHKYFAFKVA